MEIAADESETLPSLTYKNFNQNLQIKIQERVRNNWKLESNHHPRQNDSFEHEQEVLQTISRKNVKISKYQFP